MFRFPAVPPGAYAVRAAMAGFRAAEKTASVRLDGTARVDLVLQPLRTAEVLVSGAARAIDLTSTTTGTSYTSQVITRLPVSRNYAEIVRSNPGVSTDRGSTEGRSLALTIYGATSAENQWIIDGVNTTNVFKGVQGKAINNEFVQEIEVKTGGYGAEYGRALGGVVNMITKSGGNAYHGDAFVYYDSTGIAAEKQFKPGDSGIGDALRRRPAARLRCGLRRVHPQGSALGLRSIQPRRTPGKPVAAGALCARLDRGSFSLRFDGVSLFGQADLERRAFDDRCRHRLRGPVHDLGRSGSRSSAGTGPRLRHARGQPRALDVVLQPATRGGPISASACHSFSDRRRSRRSRARTTRAETLSRLRTASDSRTGHAREERRPPLAVLLSPTRSAEVTVGSTPLLTTAGPAVRGTWEMSRSTRGTTRSRPEGTTPKRGPKG